MHYRNKKAGFRAAGPLAAAAALAAAVIITACGGSGEAGEASAEESVQSAEQETEESSAEETAAAEEMSAEPEKELASAGETYPGTVSATKDSGEVTDSFGIMHASVLDVWPDKDAGVNIYSLQDESDPESIWSIPANRIGDIEADMTKGAHVAVAFKGDIIKDYEDISFIAVIPEGNYLISSVEGITTSNLMSTFSVLTDDGREMVFMKDNCEIEKDAMSGDSGDRVIVYYAQSNDGTNYPLEVYCGD